MCFNKQVQFVGLFLSILVLLQLSEITSWILGRFLWLPSVKFYVVPFSIFSLTTWQDFKNWISVEGRMRNIIISPKFLQTSSILLTPLNPSGYFT